MISGHEILYAILLIVGLIGDWQAGKMCAMQYSYHLFTRRDWEFYGPYVLGILSLAYTAYCAYQLVS